MNRNKILSIIFLNLFFSLWAKAEVPCDFKGLSIGDKKSVAEIMRVLKVKTYKVNPKLPSYDERKSLIENYGLLGAENIIDEKIGAYCGDDYCRIPAGVISVGINIPAKVFILFSKDQHQLHAIDVYINAMSWDELIPILYSKYGAQWNIEKSSMSIVDGKSKRSSSVDQIEMSHKKGGVNIRTKDTCELSASKYNSIFEQSDSLGIYQSIFEIKIISKNF